MAGKKRAANTRHKARFTNYRANGIREKNKATRITKNILKSGNPATTAYKVIKAHPNGAVQSYITGFLKKKGIEPQKPKEKEDEQSGS